MTPIAQWLLVLLFSVLVIAQSAIAIQQYNEKTPTTEANYIFSIVVISTAVIATLGALVKLGKQARAGGLSRMYSDLGSDFSSARSRLGL